MHENYYKYRENVWESHKFFGKYFHHNMEAISTRIEKTWKNLYLLSTKIDKGQMDLVFFTIFAVCMCVDYRSNLRKIIAYNG